MKRGHGTDGARRGERGSASMAVGLAACLVLALTWPGAGPSALATPATCEPGVTPQTLPEPAPARRPLRFGIYPLGEVGQVGAPADPATRERPAARKRLLRRLQGTGPPLVVHLYKVFTGAPGGHRENRQHMKALDALSRQGFDVELVLSYRPADGGNPQAVEEFVAWVRRHVRRRGDDPRMRSFQITNETNSTGAPDAADGFYAGAKDALIAGIVAADRVAERHDYKRLDFGFSWYYRLDAATEGAYWRYLGRHGGPDFRRAVDWVGVHPYPGTFFPPNVAPDGGGWDARWAMANSFSILRDCFMPLAGLPPSVRIQVTENGWPTGPQRSEAQQTRYLRAMVTAAHDFRRNYGVTDYRWFSLRDADSASANIQQRYGIADDDYAPKPAFRAYRDLIRRFGRR